uniref:SFRICE_009466 n=1 Tax=Spodoptera frugiperda TaxID=7108 RepID=A0A2H1WVK4_SPOFR
MSLVEITQHDEVIYSILDKPPPEPPKTPRYESKLEKELKEAKRPELRRTFGYAETPLKPPTEFLKKGEGIGQPIKKTDHKCYVSGNLPPVPKRPPPSKKQEKPVVNFRVINIKKAIKTKGKPVEPRLVDTRDGHIKKIKGSGEVPEFCLRPDFGQMPAYLMKRNRKIQKALEKIKYAEDNKESLCKLITTEERQKLLDDLKLNWSLMQKAFLQLPMLTDTIPKILRKTKMEADLKQLEKDIALVESNPYIYIYE